MLHFALDCVSVVMQQTDSSRFILPLLKALCSQISKEPAEDRRPDSSTSAPGLEILSNDIREVTGLDESDSDEEEQVLQGKRAVSPTPLFE